MICVRPNELEHMLLRFPITNYRKGNWWNWQNNDRLFTIIYVLNYNVKIQKVSETIFMCFHLRKTRSRFKSNLLMLVGYVKNGLGILVYLCMMDLVLEYLTDLWGCSQSKKKSPIYLEGFIRREKIVYWSKVRHLHQGH